MTVVLAAVAVVGVVRGVTAAIVRGAESLPPVAAAIHREEHKA
jgi:hypothetical protein